MINPRTEAMKNKAFEFHPFWVIDIFLFYKYYYDCDSDYYYDYCFGSFVFDFGGESFLAAGQTTYHEYHHAL